jgi:hypothetical protein
VKYAGRSKIIEGGMKLGCHNPSRIYDWLDLFPIVISTVPEGLVEIIH